METKSIVVLAMVVLLAALTGSASAQKYSGGDGSMENPYRIATAADLNDIGNHIEDFNKCFVMVNDVNLTDYTGTAFHIIGTDYDNPFTGAFDGNGHIVSNFTYTSTGTDYIALFGDVGTDGEIKNLGMVDVNVDASTGYYVGGLVGLNDYGIVSNCYATGTVTGNKYVGGLLGLNYYDGTVSNCYATGTVSGVSWVGGLVGYDYFGTVTASFWDIDTSGQATSAGGTGKTTVQMQTQSTFTDAGWNFIEIWNIGENQTYPYLRVYPAGDLNHDGRVDFFDFAIIASHWLEGTEP